MTQATDAQNTHRTDHPNAHLRRFACEMVDGIIATYRLPADDARALLPENLELRPRGPFAYTTVVIGKVKQLRPAGVPPFEGIDDVIALYTLSSQIMTPSADIHAGQWLWRMEAAPSTVQALKLYTPGFAWQTASIAWEADTETAQTSIEHQDGARSQITIGTTRPVLPRGSSFATPLDAQAFCQPAPRLWDQDLWQRTVRGPALPLRPAQCEKQSLAPVDALSQSAAVEWTQRITRPTPLTLDAPTKIQHMPGKLQDGLSPETQEAQKAKETKAPDIHIPKPPVISKLATA